MRTTQLLLVISLQCLLLSLKCEQSTAFTSPQHRPSMFTRQVAPSQRSLTLGMKKDDPRRLGNKEDAAELFVLGMKKDNPRRLGVADDKPSVLSAASISDGFAPSDLIRYRTDDVLDSLSENAKNFIPIISAAFLLTSNTVGASMMVLPDLARGPGLLVSSGLIGGESNHLFQ